MIIRLGERRILVAALPIGDDDEINRAMQIVLDFIDGTNKCSLIVRVSIDDKNARPIPLSKERSGNEKKKYGEEAAFLHGELNNHLLESGCNIAQAPS